MQHTRVTDAGAVAFISLVFAHLEADDPLWPASPAAFCYRWDHLLRHLDVPRGLGLTPGGLRGGGTVQRYRAGTSPAALQWDMRLKHLSTLEHYLQELAAVTALTDGLMYQLMGVTASVLHPSFLISRHKLFLRAFSSWPCSGTQADRRLFLGARVCLSVARQLPFRT